MYSHVYCPFFKWVILGGCCYVTGHTTFLTSVNWEGYLGSPRSGWAQWGQSLFLYASLYYLIYYKTQKMAFWLFLYLMNYRGKKRKLYFLLQRGTSRHPCKPLTIFLQPILKVLSPNWRQIWFFRTFSNNKGVSQSDILHCSFSYGQKISIIFTIGQKRGRYF